MARPVRDPDAQVLREHGLHVTASRLAVLQAVTARPHCTVNEVEGAVREAIGAVSRQAVFDALAVFGEKGLVRPFRPIGSPTRYETRVGDNHHHIVCRSCGRIDDVDCAVGERPCLSAADESGYQVDEAEVTFWGLCPDCTEKVEAETSEQPPQAT